MACTGDAGVRTTSSAAAVRIPVPAAITTVQDPKPNTGSAGKRQEPNRLAKETSPYLRQHAYNPVDWYPWGAAALGRALEEDKPIFLSIGYAACHWCHVMEHESFEDAAIAALLNEHFVCIKVDREERPDIDEIYMAAVQAMTGQGGWPMSVFLTPDLKPFYGGTYFPPDDAHGRPGFRRVVTHLATAWKDQRDQCIRGSEELHEHLQKVLAPTLDPGDPPADTAARMAATSAERFDEVDGGFAMPPHFAPKFPHASELSVLLALGHGGDDKAMAMARQSLDGMLRGGIYDQLGGGFHRYSTDRQWLVPHFEKMLYDNAQLVRVYISAHRCTGDDDYARVARETLDYVLREMTHDRGGFYSSQDADSEGVEGKFFVWQVEEVQSLLGADATVTCRRWGITDAGNWEHSNVLTLSSSLAELAAATGEDVARVSTRLENARERLLSARAERVRPATDDKILTAWNGLMIAAFADGYRAFGEERYLSAARRAAAFVLDELVVDGRCMRSWHSGRAQHMGYLEDYAMLADGLLQLFEVDSDPRWLRAGRQLLAAILEHFRDDRDGSFFFTADDHEELIARSKSVFESSMPSGVAVSVSALLRYGLLLADEELYGAGVAALRANAKVLESQAIGCPALVDALLWHRSDPREVVVVGEPGDPRTRALLDEAGRRFPRHYIVANLHEGNRAALAAMSAVFRDKELVDGMPAAYVCRRGVCERPVTDPADLAVR